MSLGSHLYVHGLRLVMVLALMRSAFAAETIVINEIMYHSKEREWKEDTSAEFLEL